MPRPSDSVPGMPIPIIIDGYNLLGARGQIGGGSSLDGERTREGLLTELILYAQRKGHRVTVVFDAYKERGRLGHEENRSGVRVLFTRGGEQADPVIQRMARRYGRDCVVVSSDLEIQHTAKDHGALVLTSQEFQAKLQLVVQAPRDTRLPGQRGRPANFGKDEDEPVFRPKDKKGNPKRLPKAKRRRQSRLKGF